MITLEAHLRIVTPLFMAGANQQQAELRVASVKGVLRYWWRAIALGRLKSLDAVKTAEDQLFGSTEGQAQFVMRLDPPQVEGKLDNGKILKNGTTTVGSGARYLGYGVMEAFASSKKGTQAGQLTRPCLLPPIDTTLHIIGKSRAKNCPKEEDWQDLRQAIIALGLFGGLGSKSRKGYGSCNLVSLKQDQASYWTEPHDAQSLYDCITKFWSAITPVASLPAYTAFSRFTRIDVVATDSNPLTVLNTLGSAMQMYRSWGKDGKVNGEPAEKNFKDDHDWSKGLLSGRRGFHPQRVVFGLPHNYGNHIDCKPASKDYERRASPLFVHIQQIGNDYAAVVAILPAQFLPNHDQILAHGVSVAPNPDYSVLDGFLDGKTGVCGKKTNQDRFPQKHNVIPGVPIS